MSPSKTFMEDTFYKYKTLSVDHLSNLQEDIDNLRSRGRLSNNKTYLSYLEDLKFEIPKNLPNARSLIVMAIFNKMMLVNFHLNGEKFEAMLPPQYYATELTAENLQRLIINEIIKEPGHKLEKATVNLKLLAVRSGLGQYGRNNLCYVDGMGSLLRLTAYFSDCKFKDDCWTEMKMMDMCQNCSICLTRCPTGCIRMESFVIDAGRCISLYNEDLGEFPEWIPSNAHNAVIGCMRCQLSCPANRETIKQVGRLEDITEEETRKILDGSPDDELLASLSRKLMNFVPSRTRELFPIFTRNLKALLADGKDH